MWSPFFVAASLWLPYSFVYSCDSAAFDSITLSSSCIALHLNNKCSTVSSIVILYLDSHISHHLFGRVLVRSRFSPMGYSPHRRRTVTSNPFNSLLVSAYLVNLGNLLYSRSFCPINLCIFISSSCSVNFGFHTLSIVSCRNFFQWFFPGNGSSHIFIGGGKSYSLHRYDTMCIQYCPLRPVFSTIFFDTLHVGDVMSLHIP